MNITPNSFSDGGKFKSSGDFKKHFLEMLTWADIVDIGAESTAPFNRPIDACEEFTRFEKYLFPLLSSLEDPGMSLSLDTYRPEVFYELYHVIKHYWPTTKIIFNDVSGKIDQDLVQLLSDISLDFTYVYSHNYCPDRSLTSLHMQYTSTNESAEFLNSLVIYFQNALERLSPFNKEIIIDPCFGFSKSRHQNHYLLKYFPDFVKALNYDGPVLYGISRKSFLRVPPGIDAKIPQNQMLLDQMQSILFYELIRENINNELILRLHDNSSLKSALNLLSILE